MWCIALGTSSVDTMCGQCWLAQLYVIHMEFQYTCVSGLLIHVSGLLIHALGHLIRVPVLLIHVSGLLIQQYIARGSPGPLYVYLGS